MFQTVLPILVFLTYYHCSVECQPCPGCDPDIPSRHTPTDWYQNTTLSKICQAGEYMGLDNQCKPCLFGMFMTAAMAKTGRYKFCIQCMKVSAVEVEEVIKECSSTRDTEINCKDGHYRAKKNNCDCDWECHLCSMCGVGTEQHLKYEKRPCGMYTNTVCCQGEDDIVMEDKCVQRPTTTTVATTKTTTRATTPEPAEEIVEQKSSKNPNSAKATEVLYSLVLLCFFHIIYFIVLRD